MLTKDAPQPDVYAYEERAAILEFDAGMSRPEAERRAAQMEAKRLAAKERRTA